MPPALPAPGSLVWIRQRRWRVERARQWRHVVRLDVRGARRAMTFLTPFDVPHLRTSSSRPVRARRQEGRARLARVAADAHRWLDLPAAVRARLRLWPYQLEPALAMLAGERRVLLADEVGLGKTVQAGLVVAEVRRRHPAARVLIVAPASVRDQWRSELFDRFGIEARVADQAGLDAMARAHYGDDNPWRRPGVWLVSADFIKQPHVFEALPESPTDLLIIDEAHDAAGESERHAACSKLGRRTRRLLLLTATPHSGDADRFGRLAALGRLRGERASPVVFRRTRRDLGFVATRRIRWRRVPLSRAGNALLDGLLEYEQRVLGAARGRHDEAALLLLAVFRKRALSAAAAFRRTVEHRLAALSASPAAFLADWLQPGLDFEAGDQPHDDTMPRADLRAVMADVGLASGHEHSWLRRLLELARCAERDDRRVSYVARIMRRTREPAIVFTEFRDALDAVSRRLNGARTIAVLHGGLSSPERAAALEAFDTGAADVLLATDVASQGLNLQRRCRWVLNLELPWNPLRLEQRAGRVDRLGQRRPVRITVLTVPHRAEHRLLSGLARRVLTARDAMGADALAAGLPREHAIWHSVLTGDDSGGAFEPAPAIAFSRRWRRPARALAHGLLRRRRLAGAWRAREPPDGRPRRVVAACVERRASIVVCSVPLVDGRGLVVERHVVGFRLDRRHLATLGWQACADALTRAAGRHLAPRVRRLARRLAVSRRKALTVEAALAEAMAGVRSDGLVQSGLFDRRAEVAAAEAAADVARLDAELRERRADLDRSATVSAGPVRIELIIEAPHS